MHWSSPSGPLGRLTIAAHRRSESQTSRLAELRAMAADTPRPPSFVGALRSGGAVALIAEVKRRSPSKGVINAGLSAPARAREYVAGGAAALSILTEPDEFGGSIDDLSHVRAAVQVALLKKDFHVSSAQVWEARALGASALLFIVRALEPAALQRLVDEASHAGLDALVEVRSELELERALGSGASAIGVNARDLETLDVDPTITARLIPMIPADRLRIAESGIATRADVERAAACGADAVLVGSSLSVARDAAGAVRALAGVPRARERGGA